MPPTSSVLGSIPLKNSLRYLQNLSITDEKIGWMTFEARLSASLPVFSLVPGGTKAVV
jgi:hypothetical protein